MYSLVTKIIFKNRFLWNTYLYKNNNPIRMRVITVTNKRI